MGLKLWKAYCKKNYFGANFGLLILVLKLVLIFIDILKKINNNND